MGEFCIFITLVCLCGVCIASLHCLCECTNFRKISLILNIYLRLTTFDSFYRPPHAMSTEGNGTAKGTEHELPIYASEDQNSAPECRAAQNIFLRTALNKHVLYFPRHNKRLPKSVVMHQYSPTNSKGGANFMKPIIRPAYQITRQCEYYAIRLPLLRGGLRRLPFAVALPPMVFQHPLLKPLLEPEQSVDAPRQPISAPSANTEEEYESVLTWTRPVKTATSIASALQSGFQTVQEQLKAFQKHFQANVDLESQQDALLSLQRIQSIFFSQFDFLQTQLLMRPISGLQRYNHWPGSAAAIGDKKGLQQNIDQLANKLLRTCQSKNVSKGTAEIAKVPFVIPTFCLPQERSKLKKAVLANRAQRHPEKNLWIVKPARGSCGRGIFICNDSDKRFKDLIRKSSAILQKVNSEDSPQCASKDTLLDKARTQEQQQPQAQSDCVVQKYIANPLLYNGYKFDMRLYVLVTSIHPFVCYKFPEGMVRFAAEPYHQFSDAGSDGLPRPPSAQMDKFRHLTNYSVGRKYTQKICQLLQSLCEEPIEPSDLPASWAPKLKMRLSEFSEWLTVEFQRNKGQKMTHRKFDAKVNDLILSTLLASRGKLQTAIRGEDAFWKASKANQSNTFEGWHDSWKAIFETLQKSNVGASLDAFNEMQPLKRYVETYNAEKRPSQKMQSACFELYGFDIMVDSHCNPLLIEVNVLPSLESSSGLDYDLKNAVLTDLLNLMCFPYCEKGQTTKPTNTSLMQRILQENCSSAQNQFKRIFPTTDTVKRYESCFTRNEQKMNDQIMQKLNESCHV